MNGINMIADFYACWPSLQAITMNNEPSSGEPHSTPPPDSIQFDRADFAGNAALSCVLCKTPISGEYYQVNGQTVCAACRPRFDALIAGGSKFSRAFRAAGGGLAAAIAGFLIYWAIRALTGYELALVSILVGWMVGVAVRWGSQRRGGLFYQLMAVALTYCSIASNYCPDILKGMREAEAKDRSEATGQGNADNSSSKKVTAPSANEARARHREIPFWFQLIVAFVISLAAPFLMGAGNFMGWIIIAVGLWEAWRLNRRIPIDITGPFSAGAQPQVA